MLIPAYRPGGVLKDIVAGLLSSPHIRAVVIVDDGSGREFAPIFRALASRERVCIASHIANRGKGAALKTGFVYARDWFPESLGVVTADADGQHAIRDILRVAQSLATNPRQLTVGVRAFDSSVPLRSRFGNIVTKHVLRLITGKKLADTQSGLRGIPSSFIPDLVKLRANGYDYELDMLLACHRTHWPVREVPIQTIYLDGNRSSHFNPILDSFRIYFVLVRFTSVSLLTAIIDNAVFLAAFGLWRYILPCQLLGRAIAGTFNYRANKNRVFQLPVSHSTALPRYWFTVAIFAAAGYALIRALNALGMPVGWAKLTVETALFALGFVVQRELVFKSRSTSGQRTDSDVQDS